MIIEIYTILLLLAVLITGFINLFSDINAELGGVFLAAFILIIPLALRVFKLL